MDQDRSSVRGGVQGSRVVLIIVSNTLDTDKRKLSLILTRHTNSTRIEPKLLQEAIPCNEV
jgi:hypothetical protein